MADYVDAHQVRRRALPFDRERGAVRSAMWRLRLGLLLMFVLGVLAGWVLRG